MKNHFHCFLYLCSIDLGAAFLLDHKKAYYFIYKYFTYTMNANQKETTQYIVAIITLFSGIIMCFLSFFLNKFNIEDSVLMYFGQTLIFCGAVFGLNIMIKNKVDYLKTQIMEDINHKIKNHTHDD